MFWGLVLEPSKKYTQRVERSFHMSQAALEITSADFDPVQLLLEFEDATYVLGTLSKKQHIYQVPLDLNFKEGDQISFRTIGKGRVYLSGYHLLDMENFSDQGDSELDETEPLEETLPRCSAVTCSGKRKKDRATLSSENKRKKKQKLDTTNEQEDAEDIDDSDEDDSLDESSASLGDTRSDGRIGDSTLFEDSDLSDEEDEDSDFGEEEGSDDEDDDDEDDDEEEESDSDDEPKPRTPKSDKKKPQNTSVNVNGINSSKKDKKDQSKSESKSPKKGKKENETPKKDENSPKKAKTPKTPKQDGRTPKKENATPKSDGKTPNQLTSPTVKKVLEGGVIIEEMAVGDGPVAKPGRVAQVYYLGKLKSNGKSFDAANSGPGFKFRLGRGEVIKGWDIGVNGMRVGGKRRITVPPHLAYGSKGSPPVIPPNAALMFDVHLIGLS